MKSILPILSLLLSFGLSLSAQSYFGAESVEYDPVNQRWLVSNNSNIIADDGMGNLSFFGNGVKASHGMEVLGNTIFGIDNDVIRGFDLNTEMEVATLTIPGVSFLNGITSDGNSNLYVTDFSAGKIYRVDASDLNNLTYEEIVGNTESIPNGIIYDGANNRLIFVNWGPSAKIKAVDLSDNSVSTLLTTNLRNLDGIDEDNEGNYYVSSWDPAQISKFDPDFANPLEIITTPFINNPADIGYALQNDSLGIPIGNNVVFVDLDPDTTTSVSNISILDINLTVFPNPVSQESFISFDLENQQQVQLKILDQHGKTISTLLENTCTPGNHKVLLTGHHLVPGIYFCQLRLGNNLLTKKIMVL